MTKQHELDLDPYVATSQVFQKKILKTKHFKTCKRCKKNREGFCTKYGRWCYACTQNCFRSDKRYYSYKDTYGKWHVIKY